MTYRLFVQKNVATTLSFPAAGFSGTPTFLARTGGSSAFAPFPGATVTVASGKVNVAIPAGTYYPKYFRLTDNTNTVEGLIEWTPAPVDNRVDISQLKFDPATQAELDTAAAGKENVGTAQALVTAAKLKQTNTQAGAYTLTIDDGGKVVEVNSATAVAVTVPTNATVAFPVGTVVTVRQLGAGAVSVAAAAGVTIRSAGGALRLSAQYAEATLTKRAADEWVLAGSIAV